MRLNNVHSLILDRNDLFLNFENNEYAITFEKTVLSKVQFIISPPLNLKIPREKTRYQRKNTY